MDLIQLVLTLAFFGALLWVFNKYATFIDGNIKMVINCVVLVAVIVWLAHIFGVLPNIRVGK